MNTPSQKNIIAAAMLAYLPIAVIARAAEQHILPDLATIVGEYARSTDSEVFYALDWSCQLSDYFRVGCHGNQLYAVHPDDTTMQKHLVRCTIGKIFNRYGYLEFRVWISADLDSGYFAIDNVHFNAIDLCTAILHRSVPRAEQRPLLIFSDMLSARIRAAALEYESEDGSRNM